MPQHASAVFSASDPKFIDFPSRRSVVHSANGMVACTQPLAAEAGQRILRDGGNAADAAVAVAAALNMTEPASTGIGGDMFCLFYNAKTKKIESINGSGRSAGKSSLEQMRKDLGVKLGQTGSIPMSSVHSVTTPGAAAGWVDTVDKLGSGKITLKEILSPAIELGEKGFPVSQLSSTFWKAFEQLIRDANPTNSGEMLKSDKDAPDGKRAPGPGELFYNPTLANTFRLLANEGKKGFYSGPVAESLVKAVQDRGGHLQLEDLNYHLEAGSESTTPISLQFNGQNIGAVENQSLDGQDRQRPSSRGVEVWEHPPNGQGIVALMALGILEELEKTKKIRTFTEKDHNCAEYLHALIEALRIAFADGTWFVTDPTVVKVPTQELISRPYLAERAKLFNPNKAMNHVAHGSPAHRHSDTVYFATADREGNGCSFINSVYGGFGSRIIPEGCGFTLQNRGASFSLDQDHPNVFAPRKRPYHTIIPAMVTNADDGSLHSVYGVMGGAMQPQGHVQVLLNMLAFKYNPQAALDAPRVCVGAGFPEQGEKRSHTDDKTHARPADAAVKNAEQAVEPEVAEDSTTDSAANLLDTVYLEEGISDEVASQLRALGHKVAIVKGLERAMFGRGQVIRCHMEDNKHIYSAGSDPRGDGAAFPV